ncbi:rhomboid family intramembrane serine protease [Amylibacter sp. IMCC11727]|uniref:rhomboid family intramembrane serine protease n=1 Tax=Amylibacter sp. IMCC11727 TaxID=3039851 RepID=UPI00244DC5F9|nr:rhomboid family intramembrane serine protease [Amylibacter sp. IMCC11727]WGI21602.1 rhomboid family intramembrane serine protease [Amylibacter sp. IMCC11727]
MFDPNADAAPINPLPQVVILLAVLIAVPEVIFQLGEQGLIGGPDGATWRIVIAEKYAFSNAAVFWMWDTGQYPFSVLIRFVTYMFIHANFVAALFSLVFVLALGKFVGERMSSASVLGIYLGSGILGALLQALFNGPTQAMIGGSAASFGMIGALSWILFSQQRASGDTGLKAFRLILQLAIFLGVMAYLFGGKGWVDCVAGFCVGFPLAAILRPAEGVGVTHWFERMRSR